MILITQLTKYPEKSAGLLFTMQNIQYVLKILYEDHLFLESHYVLIQYFLLEYRKIQK